MSTQSHQQLQEQLQAAKSVQQGLYNLLDRLPEDPDTETVENDNYKRARSAISDVAEIVNNLSAAAAVAT